MWTMYLWQQTSFKNISQESSTSGLIKHLHGNPFKQTSYWHEKILYSLKYIEKNTNKNLQ